MLVLKLANQDTLVIFDVDYVIITPKDKVLRPVGEREKFRKSQFDWLKISSRGKLKKIQGKSIDLGDYLLSVIGRQAKIELVHSQIPYLIRDLQARHIPVIALTNSFSAPLGLISSQADQRINDLKRFNIDFSGAFENLNRVELKQVAGKKGKPPLYQNGVLFTNGAGKGETLKTLLEYAGFKPKKIIFIDDRMECIDSVKRMTEEREIPLLAIHFILLCQQPELLDKEIARYQFTYLLKIMFGSVMKKSTNT